MTLLDEAHIIRDANTDRAKACFALKSENRICLTGTIYLHFDSELIVKGTPVQNKVDDLYSLFRFIQIDPLDNQAYVSHCRQSSKPR